MKKNFTPQQLKELQELGYESGDSLADAIEFLGEDLGEMYRSDRWHVEGLGDCFVEQELCDALFSAVKHKLNG